MKYLFPLEKSHSANKEEEELKALTISLFQHLVKKAEDINCTGMPFLGSRDLLIKYLIHEGIANFNYDVVADDDLRYLLFSWKYKNYKRGTDFLETFLCCLWGKDFRIDQLWQHKQQDYPLGIKSIEEIAEIGDDRNDYFLTSRLRISLQGNKAYFPTELAKSIHRILPARLMVNDIRREIVPKSEITFANYASIESVNDLNGIDVIEVEDRNIVHGYVTQASVHSIVTGNISDE